MSLCVRVTPVSAGTTHLLVVILQVHVEKSSLTAVEASDAVPSAQTTQSRYEVLNEIASGGMGVVYRVLDRVTGELQAMKRVSATGASRRTVLDAFEREYRVLASLHHPRIVRVNDYGVDADGPYYTMELLEGQDLRRAAPLPYRRVCSILRDVATSLTLLHARRLVHRDLSPNNVRVTPQGHCKLLDFGALTGFGVTSHVVGTPPLIAPEALHDGVVDQRTDLYALGALGYFLLTGRHAYPARSLPDLEAHWGRPPAPPSSISVDVPAELDTLVMSLLSQDPLARPSMAAEVISRLDVIGELPPETRSEAESLAQSFFISPRFSGRNELVRRLSNALAAAIGGKGSALCITSAPGMGRTRLLEELTLQARIAGATVLFADASMTRQLQGTAATLTARLFERLPELAEKYAAEFGPALAALGRRAELGEPAVPAPPSAEDSAPVPSLKPSRPLPELFADIAAERSLVIAVDNLEDADNASLGMLASLASLTERHRLLLVATEANTRTPAIASVVFRRHSQQVQLEGLSSFEMQGMLRSIFAETPNLERFSEWVHQHAMGSPLHAIELCRRMLARGEIRYAGGLWSLPNELPRAEAVAGLEETLADRLAALSDTARSLAECLSLQRDQPTLALCVQLCSDAPDPRQQARELLDELAASNVLYSERDGYRFSSSALRGALLENVKGYRLAGHHRRLGEAFAQLAASQDLALRIEAGYHLILGGDELRGAEMIASATRDSAKLRGLIANLYRTGRPVEAALKIYRRHRRSPFARMPLLAALAQAGYYEERYYDEHYSDEALEVLEYMSGLATARWLRRFLGNGLAVIVGFTFAYLRFVLTPRREKGYSFREVLEQLFGTAMTTVGTAALSLDGTRARAVADVLEPLAFLPERTTPVGVYQFCCGLSEIPRENEVAAYATFEKLISRFSDPTYYRAMTRESRLLSLAGAHFARGSFALFRADASATLESANALEATGFKLYAMVASQLRFLYHAARGEFMLGAKHRDQVELHAAQVGSVWQVETWEAAALILIHAVALGEVVGATRVVHQLATLSRTVPSLVRYHRLAEAALVVAHRDTRYIAALAAQYSAEEPRSYIGWAAVQGVVIRSYNEFGEFETAKAIGDRALEHITDADRDLVALFLPIDIHYAGAEAGLGNVDAALARLDGLIARFKDCDHPLLHGMLHEQRAYICWDAQRIPEYHHSLAQADQRYRSTGNPALIAKAERLASMRSTVHSHRTSLEEKLRVVAQNEAENDADTQATLTGFQRPHNK